MAASAGATATLAPLLLRNLFTSIFIYADQSLLNLARKCKFLEFLRSFLISTFLFFLHLLPSLFPQNRTSKAPKTDQSYVAATAAGGGGDSGIARALSQVLSIVSDIPVSSRKYEVVRSLAERLIDENLQEGLEALREVNRTVLSASFARTLNQLEAAMAEQRGGAADGCGRVDYGLNRVFRAVRSAGDVAWSRVGWRREEVSRKGSSAEKLAAELLWLAQKMEASGSGEEAVCLWASASNLAWLALSAEARLQGSLVKVSAHLFKQAKEMGREEEENIKKEQRRQTNMKMLMSWLPLLCRGSNGIDTPVLSISERAELEKVLEEIIEMLEQEEEQEKVLSLWLHHFTYCPSSDWPNLLASYTRWCTTSRKLIPLH